MKSRGLAFVVSGPSGVGKGTLVRRLMDEFPNIKFSISYTLIAVLPLSISKLKLFSFSFPLFFNKYLYC